MKYITIGLMLTAGLLSSVTSWAVDTIDTIDVLVVYPAAPALENADVVARIASMEQYANKALKNSNAKIRYRVVHIEKLDIPELNSLKTDKAALRAVKANKEAQSLRVKYGADLVSMITPTGPYCGVGYVLGGSGGKISGSMAKFGYSVVNYYCTSSFAHELGHNLSLGHSYKQGSIGGLYSWGRGHGVQGQFVTNMAYSSPYGAGKVQAFSNPDLMTCKGLSCGSPITEEDGANAVRALNVAGPQVSAWYEASTPPIVIVNGSPKASNDVTSTRQDEALNIPVLSNDADPEQDALTITGVTAPNSGSARIYGNVIRYTPKPLFIGYDKFNYTISDGHGNTAIARVRVIVGFGVDYKYYEGQPNYDLSNLSQLTPVAEGFVNNFSTVKRKRNAHYAFAFNGQIKILDDGDYQFFVKSDNRHQLLIDGQLLLNYSGNAIKTAGSGISLTKGFHTIEVRYAHASGSQRFNVYWQQPNRTLREIPSSFLREAVVNASPIAKDDKVVGKPGKSISIDVLSNDADPDGDAINIVKVGQATHGRVRSWGGKNILYSPNSGFTGTDKFSYEISDGQGGIDRATVFVEIAEGFKYEYFEGNWNKLPDFDKIKPVETGVTKNLRRTERNRNDNFGFRYTAKINVPQTGLYSFWLFSDDGSRLLIDNKTIVDNDHVGIRGESLLRRINLTAGSHDLELDYFNKSGRNSLMLYLGGKGLDVNGKRMRWLPLQNYLSLP